MNRKIKTLLVVSSAALAFYTGTALLRGTETVAPTVAHTQTDTPADSSSELWSDDSTLHPIKPLDVALDTETQWTVFRTCDYDPGLFCLVMAIAEQESGFDTQMAGDGGDSVGIMQINIRWHTGRMEVLGVTDLTNPVQCAAVAIDYLRELESCYGFEPESEALVLAYNMGPNGAKKALHSGAASTDYSQEVMTKYQIYLKELEA